MNPVAATAQSPGRAAWPDNCSSDRQFGPVLRRFKAIVARRDAAGLITLTHPEIRIDNHGANGLAAFIDFWKLRGPGAQGSPIWAELDTVIRLGCLRSQDTAVLPNFSEVELGGREEMGTLIVIGTGVALRSGPSTATRALNRLNYRELVSPDGPEPKQAGWARIKTEDGTIGFVRKTLVRWMTDIGADFELKDGKWTLTRFMGGD